MLERQRTAARAGMSAIEVIVVVSVMAILTAAIIPGVIGILDRERVKSSAESLAEITDAMTEMRQDNLDWPGRLSHLSTPITTADVNICGSTYAQGKVNQWLGPYLDRVVPAAGLPLAIGTASDTLVRSIISGNDAYLIVRIRNVAHDDARALNRLLDADSDSLAGNIRWGALSQGLVTVDYARPIRGC